MGHATVRFDPDDRVGAINPRLYGNFVEHLGRCVYTGIYEPGHPSADEDGLRQDVIDLVKELGITIVRYPGGNFVSGFRWEDSVGSKDQRPTRLDLAWHSLETNQFGLDEFMTWCRKTGVEPMMAVNLGSRGPLDAVDLLDYCNGVAPTTLANQRRANGHDEPYGVRMWCLGNEMDGPWQFGHKTPQEYARIAAETGRVMKQFDPDLELVAAGSSSPLMETFGEWERTVLEEAWDQVSHVSLHRYYEPIDGDMQSFLASADDLDAFIRGIVATADAVAARKHSDKRIQISVDEWNVWYSKRAESIVPSGDDWPVAPPLLEDKYCAADAVVVGDLMITLLANADRVTAACMAQLVNVIGPIMTEKGGRAWRQTIFHPFAITAREGRGDTVRSRITSPRVATAQHGEVDAIRTVVTRRDDDSLAIFATNRDLASEHTLFIDARDCDGREVKSAQIIHHDDLEATNTADHPDTVVPVDVEVRFVDGGVEIDLPAVSWAVITLA